MHQSDQNNHQKHIPVLLNEVLQYLGPKAGESYLDLTAGYGGHAREILEGTKSPEQAVLVDRDQNAINDLTQLFGKSGVSLRHEDFLSASKELAKQGRQFDIILADLGVSSPHLNEANRGFAITASGPLDMRMDQTQTLTADTIVNSYGEEELMQMLQEYGEEPHARKIAQLIVHSRPIATTNDLAAIVARAWPGRARVHPATRTFQALRIAVNNELGLLTQALPLWFTLLNPGGRLAVISFHSLEDRIVKQAMREVSGDRFDASMRELTKRPIAASHQELVFNPRSRSAKLRVAVKK